MSSSIASGIRRALLFAIALFFAVDAARADVCVDPRDSACEDTIQAGIDAATNGETVTVADGIYRETVSIDLGQADITLKGESQEETIIEPIGPSGMFIDGANATIKKLTIRRVTATAINLNATASGALIKNVTIEGARIGIFTQAGATTVDGVTIREGSTGIDADTGGLEIRNSTFARLGTALGMTVADTTIENNAFERVDTAIDLRLQGGGVVVRSNAIDQVARFGVYIDGDGIEIEDNTIASAQIGVFVRGNGFAVRRNQIFASTGRGLDVSCDVCPNTEIEENTIEGGGNPAAMLIDAEEAGLIAKNNTVQNAYHTAIQLTGTGTLLTGSTVVDCGTRPFPGVEILGDDMTVEDTSVENCTGDGFRVSGDDNLIRDSEAKKNREAGFALTDGRSNRVLRSTAKKNFGTGFTVWSDSEETILDDNEATKNAYSLCDEGTDTELAGNDFPTVVGGCGT